MYSVGHVVCVKRSDLTALGKYAHTFVGQALFLAMRAFLSQGAMSDSVNGW